MAAAAAVQRMQTAVAFYDFRQAWEDFLNRLAKVWIKAERECHPLRHEFQPWQGFYKQKLREDPLLAYVSHARNADHHTIQPIAAVAIDIEASLPPGATAVIDLNSREGRISMKGNLEDVAVTTPKCVLLPIKDRGVVFPAPVEHLGAPISDNDPLNVARLALAFFEDFVEKASARFEQPDSH